MTRGRHRQQLPTVKTVSGVTVGTVATAGLALAVVSGNTQVLRLAVVASWLIALGLVAHSVRRGRQLQPRARAAGVDAPPRRVAVHPAAHRAAAPASRACRPRWRRCTPSPPSCGAEIAQLRVEKAEADEIVRQARAERAKAQLAEREASDQRLLTAAAFEAAAAVLQSFGNDDAGLRVRRLDRRLGRPACAPPASWTSRCTTRPSSSSSRTRSWSGVIDELPIAKSA